MATATKASDRFYCWHPFELVKAGETEGDDPEFEGIVSSERRDEDGEIVVQKGIEWGYFRDNGKVTYGHPATNANVIGEPIEVAPTDLGGIPAHRMRGRLFRRYDKLARRVSEKATALQKSSERTRLGLSVEGRVLERDPNDPTRITRCRVTSVAVDANPKNPDARMELAASLGVPFDDLREPHAPTTVSVPAPSALEKSDAQRVRVLRRFPGWTWDQAGAFIASVAAEEKR